jgi:RHS repeat-associated protein
MSAAFVYDGDGRQVKSIINGVTTLFVGAHYEVQGTTITKYYFAGASRIAMRSCTGGTCSAPTYLLGDHLGSTSLVTDANGVKISEQRYKPWGETRSGTLPTKYQYTGQRSEMDSLGLYFYAARWYDPLLGRFNQPDTDVPASQGVQAYDRYAYVSNNPLRYTDPTGHMDDDGDGGSGCVPGDLACQIEPYEPVDLHLAESVVELVHDQFTPSLDGAPNLAGRLAESVCLSRGISGCGETVVGIGTTLHLAFDAVIGMVANSTGPSRNTNFQTPTEALPISTPTIMPTPALNISQVPSPTVTSTSIPTASATSSKVPTLTLMPTPSSPFITITPTLWLP